MHRQYISQNSNLYIDDTTPNLNINPSIESENKTVSFLEPKPSETVVSLPSSASTFRETPEHLIRSCEALAIPRMNTFDGLNCLWLVHRTTHPFPPRRDGHLDYHGPTTIRL
jgi:hypothetical protein